MVRKPKKKNKKEGEDMGVISTVTFNKDMPQDKEVMIKINQVCSLSKYRGFAPTAIVRNIVIRAADSELEDEKNRQAG